MLLLRTTMALATLVAYGLMLSVNARPLITNGSLDPYCNQTSLMAGHGVVMNTDLIFNSDDVMNAHYVVLLHYKTYPQCSYVCAFNISAVEVEFRPVEDLYPIGAQLNLPCSALHCIHRKRFICHTYSSALHHDEL